MAHTIERIWETEAGLRAVCLLIHDLHRCGYVEVPKGHPLHGCEYGQETDAIQFDEDNVPVGKRGPILALTAGVGAKHGNTLRHSPDVAFDVHGGITYSGGHGYPIEGEGWWFGFDCGHAGDGSLNPTLARSGPVRSEAYVASECERLAAQIVEMVPLAARNATEDWPMPDLSRTCPTWDAEPLADRLERCRRLLSVEGLLTDSESARVVQRIEREWERLERVEGESDAKP